MTSSFASAPPGFFATNEVINVLPENIVSQLISETLDVSFSKTGVLSAQRYLKWLASSGSSGSSSDSKDGKAAPPLPAVKPPSVSEQSMQSVIHAVAFVIRCAGLDRLSGTALAAALVQRTDLNERRRALFVNAWTTHSANGVLVSSPASVASSSSSSSSSKSDGKDVKSDPLAAVASLRLGQLMGLDWKLGVGISSSHCRALNSPFVSLVLRVAEPDGRVTAHALELTLAQFQEFSKTFREIRQQLDTV